jgi:DNA-binding MarR family transcriptional regulator
VSDPKQAAKRDAILKRVASPHAQGETRPADAPLDWDDIGFLSHGLVFGHRLLHQATKGVTERYSLGPRGGWTLNLISRGIVHPHELSEVLRIGRSLVSAELSRMTEAGLIVSETAPNDRRHTELTLTTEGQKALNEVRGELFRILTEALSGYSPDQVRLMSRMLYDLQASARGASPG